VVTSSLFSLPVGTAPGLTPRWQELYASGAELGTAAPRLRELSTVKLRSGPLFDERGFVGRLLDRHRRIGADAQSMAAIEDLGAGAACVITGQQPHLLTGPFYTVWKLLGAIALAQRLEEIHGSRVVPVYWCGSDDSDFAEVGSAWLFDRERGPWRLRIPANAWKPGMAVGDIAATELIRLEDAALTGLRGPGLEWFREAALEIGEADLGDRTAAWVLRMFRESGLVVVDARDDLLVAAARPLFERYAGIRAEAAAAVGQRARLREQEGWQPALDPSARQSGIFARRDGLRVKLSPEEIDSGSALSASWGPSVLLRPVVQDALLAPVAAVLGPGELAYHAEIAPLYGLLGVEAARPVPRPHLTLVGEDWDWPTEPEDIRRLLAGSSAAVGILSRMGLPAAHREVFDDFGQKLETAIHDFEVGLGHRVEARPRARIQREIQRLINAEADRVGGAMSATRRAEWLARGKVSQERIYSSWMLWAWFGNPAETVLRPLAEAYVRAVDQGTSVQWALPVVEIP
jgi:hypothetical protein